LFFIIVFWIKLLIIFANIEYKQLKNKIFWLFIIQILLLWRKFILK